LRYHPGLISCPVCLPEALYLKRFRGAGYTFGSGVVYKFLDENNMHHILRAHQLCMEGYSSLFDKHLSTVWSAPNYCYRCGNSASILEVGPGGSMYFNVFEAAPENDRDGPTQQAAQNAGGKVGFLVVSVVIKSSFRCSFLNIFYNLCFTPGKSNVLSICITAALHCTDSLRDD
jgi:hypothetical protein